MIARAAARFALGLGLAVCACSNNDPARGAPAAPPQPDADGGPEGAIEDAADEAADDAELDGSGDETDGEAGPCVPGDAAIPNPPMVFVAAGPFWMGCDEQSDPDCTVAERPRHEVTLPGYWIDRHEVTMLEYEACVQACVCTPPHGWFDPVQRPDHPVVGVDYDQARGYCAWLGRALPTEAQWEKAARSADGRRYPWGEDPPDCQRAAWLGCAFDAQSGVTFAGGTFSPQGDSPWGAQDMAGNVWEWVMDGYAPYGDGGQDEAGAGSGIRIWRGGSYLSGALSLRASHRRPEKTPYYRALGLRCVANL